MTRGVYCQSDAVHCLVLEGHANYAPYGQDIVCAGLSALSFALADFLQRDCAELVQCHKTEGFFWVTALRSAKTDPVFALVVHAVQQLATQFPNCVQMTQLLL